MALTEQSAFIKGEPVDEHGLKAIIAMEMENALGIDGGKLSIQRRDALKQYEGEPYGNEVDGRSQVVDRTILETVEWIMPALMRIFAGSEQIVEVQGVVPTGTSANPQMIAQIEEQAREMTAYANYIFNEENPGFMLLYTWFKDALLQKLGWVDAYWDTDRRTEDEKYSGLTEDQYQALKGDPDLEEIECVAYPAFAPLLGLVHQEAARSGAQALSAGQPLSPLFPQPSEDLAKAQGAPTIYDCTFRRTYNEGRVKLTNKPPEEVLISRRAQRDNVPFLCERTRRTRSELIEAGFDYDTVMTLSPFDEQEYNTERIQRFFKNDEWPYRSARTDPAMVEVWVNICYLKVDMEGDGIAKLRKVTVGGDKTYEILGNELWDEITLHSTTPIPQPHTLVGLSVADLVSDLQLIKTTLWRQTLDNLYLANNPRTYVNENAVTENTYDDLLTSRPGGLIRGNGPADQAVFPFVTPFVGQSTMQMLSYIDESGEKRTGISKGNQGIAPDDLNKNAAIGSQGVGMLQEAAAQRVELIARIFAEDVKRLFKGIIGLVVRNQQGARTVQIAGQWIPINPANWKKQFNLRVSVGLGTGNRDKMVGQLTQLAAAQQQIVTMQKGLGGPLVTAPNAFNLLCSLTESMGFKNPLKFWTNPANAPPQQPGPPDPQVQAAQIKAQADQQAAQAKAQIDAQSQAQELQMRERLGIAELQMKFQLEMAKLGIEGKRFELDEATTRAEIGLKTDEHRIKHRGANPDAVPRRKYHELVRGDPHPVTGHRPVIGVNTTEIPEPIPGSLPEGPQIGHGAMP